MANFDAIKIYGPEEQAVRIVSLLDENSLVVPPPINLPSAVREVYESAAQQFILDHPFVRGGGFTSIVFADYIKASMCNNLLAQSSLSRDPVASITDVGPFFMRFVHRFVTIAQGGVPEELVESLLQSWILENELGSEDAGFATVLLGPGPALVEFPSMKSDVDESTAIPVHEVTGALHLVQPLRDVMVLTDQGLILGSRGEPLIIGPNVILAAAEIEIEANDLNLGWSSKPSAVTLNSAVLVANQLVRISGQKANLSVYTQNPPPILNSYLRELKSGPRWIPYSDFVDLRAILTAFRSSVHLGLCASSERLIGLVVKENADRQRILSSLVSRGVVSVQNDWYLLNASSLTDVGFSLSELKSGHPNSKMIEFLCGSRDVDRSKEE